MEDVENEMQGFPQDLLWVRPGGVASVCFHLKHLSGVLERLFTYAKGDMLNEEQMTYLKTETVQAENDSVDFLVDRFRKQVTAAINELKVADINTLTDKRAVGRKQIPSTKLGLWFHAAEHTQRHVGQLIVTARILRAQAESKVS